MIEQAGPTGDVSISSPSGAFYVVVETDGSWSVTASAIVRNVPLVEAQRRTEMEREAAALAPEVERLRANPSAALREYEERMRPIQRDFGIAYAASLCQLRSDRYFVLFKEARQRVYEKEVARRRLSTAEWKAADSDMNRVLQETFVEVGLRDAQGKDTLGVACRKLFNSPELDRLDQIERGLTGNYH